MNFEKVKKTTLVDQVCKIIKEKIKENHWPEGTKIPSENELAEAFGVNRLTVRNALQKLNAMGIVETRAGEGTFVKQFDILKYIYEMSDLMVSPEMLDGVMDFRKCIELECGRLAIERASSEDIAELEEAYKKYERISKEKTPFEDHVNALVNADIEFHLQICRMSKNSLFVLAYSAVKETIFQYIKSVFANRYLYYKSKPNLDLNKDFAASRALKTHREIIQAIKNRDFEMYKKTYINMIDYEKLD